MNRRTFFKRLGMLAALPLAAKLPEINPVVTVGNAGDYLTNREFYLRNGVPKGWKRVRYDHEVFSSGTKCTSAEQLRRSRALANSVMRTKERIVANAFNRAFTR